MLSKKYIQMRLLRNGVPLSLDEFDWDEQTRTLILHRDNVMVDFSDIHTATIKAKACTVIRTHDRANITAQMGASIITGSYSTITVSAHARIEAGFQCDIRADHNATIDTKGAASIVTGPYSTVKAYSGSTIKMGYQARANISNQCVIETENRATIAAGDNCKIQAAHNSIIQAMDNCKIRTGDNSVIEAGDESAISVSANCIVRHVPTKLPLMPCSGDIIQFFPCGIYLRGKYLLNGQYKGEDYIIADGILSKIIKQRGNVYRVKNHGEKNITYLVKKGDIFSHGETFREAKEGLMYKLSDRDTTKYENYTLATQVDLKEAIQMYMCITGACEGGVRYFMERLGENKKSQYSIAEIIFLTRGQYGHHTFKQFFEKEGASD